MNWLDVVLVMVLAGSVLAALAKGLTREVVGVVTVITALLAGLWFYGTAGSFLLPYVSSKSIANFCGFLIVFFGIMILGSLAGALLGKLLRITGLSFLDRALGGLFGLVRGIVVAVALVLAMMAFAPAKEPPRAVVDSRLAPYVIDGAKVVAAIAPYELKDGFRKSYEKVRGVWEDTFRKGIRELPKSGKAQHEREI